MTLRSTSRRSSDRSPSTRSFPLSSFAPVSTTAPPGRNFRDGLILGGSEDDPARFLLVGPDTTLSFFATPSDRWRTYDDSLTIEPGASLDLLLVADNAWVAMRRSDPTFVEMDSVAFVNFFVRSLQHGHLLYAADSTSPDTLAFVRAPNARVEVVSPAP